MRRPKLRFRLYSYGDGRWMDGGWGVQEVGTDRLITGRMDKTLAEDLCDKLNRLTFA